MTLYIFDKDGTLVGGLSNRPANTPDEQQPLPGVVAKIAELRSAGHQCYIASNQGGVSWGFITYEQARELIADAAIKCSIEPFNALMCPFDERGQFADQWRHTAGLRKPLPGMLTIIMQAHPDIDDVIMIGDQDSDKQAAEASGVRFEWAADFFGWR